jgi:hypothetical protein
MLLLLVDLLRELFGLKIPAVFTYFSTRMIFGALTALLFTIFLGPQFISGASWEEERYADDGGDSHFIVDGVCPFTLDGFAKRLYVAFFGYDGGVGFLRRHGRLPKVEI